jgi:LPS export ABC transporter protein LptC
MKISRIFLLFIMIGSAFSCGEGLEEKKQYEEYDGPSVEMDTVTIFYSDSAVVRVEINADKQFGFENGDKEFPEGIFIEFYDKEGELSSTLEAKKGFYTKETDLYKAEGDVEVIGYVQEQKLNSEELFWDPNKEEIYTDKFVRVESGGQLSTGTGLTAKQDFSTYRILKPEGTIILDENAGSSDDADKEDTDRPSRPNKKKISPAQGKLSDEEEPKLLKKSKN